MPECRRTVLAESQATDPGKAINRAINRMQAPAAPAHPVPATLSPTPCTSVLPMTRKRRQARLQSSQS
jgi:hypothetical protein